MEGMKQMLKMGKRNLEKKNFKQKGRLVTEKIWKELKWLALDKAEWRMC